MVIKSLDNIYDLKSYKLTEIKKGNLMFNNNSTDYYRNNSNYIYSKNKFNNVWDKDLKEGEFKILYNLFFYLSCKIDAIRGINNNSSKNLNCKNTPYYPKTNLRFLSNIYQFISHIFLLFLFIIIIFYLLKLRVIIKGRIN